MLADQKTFYVIGVMSGTSLDGMDFAYLRFSHENEIWNFKFLTVATCPYSKEWELRLKQAHQLEEEALLQLDIAYTTYLSDQIRVFCKQHRVERVDAICTHGHTVLHKPEEGVTLQIGNRKELATSLGKTVVCDFRKQDVVLGGQGAPLVPMGDFLLFKEFDGCLNLGGFANASLLNRKEVVAFDIGAVNTVLNRLMNTIGKAYDAEGRYARSGAMIPKMLERLNAIAFYDKALPKSLGIEWVDTVVFPVVKDFSSHSLEDVLHTYCQHIGQQIGGCFKQGEKVLVTGGGCLNTFLMECINQHTQAEMVIPNSEMIHFKEALIFGLLGVLRLQRKVNCFVFCYWSNKRPFFRNDF